MMEGYAIFFSDQAIKDLKQLRKESKSLLARVIELQIDMQANPYTGVGKPEGLKHLASGAWSRRIDKKHRLVYLVEEEARRIIILAAYGHYGDK